MTRLLAAFVAFLSASALAAPAATTSRGAPAQARTVAAFRAPALPPALGVSLPAPMQKQAAAQTTADGPLRVGFTRELAKAAALEAWTRVPGGYAMRLTASSDGAEGLRALRTGRASMAASRR